MDKIIENDDIQSYIEEELNESEMEYSDDWPKDKYKTDDLRIGKQFISWQEVILFLDDYCIQKGFGYR